MTPTQHNRKLRTSVLNSLINLGVRRELSPWDNQKTRYLNIILMVAGVSAVFFVGVNLLFGNLAMAAVGGSIVVFNALLFLFHFFGHPYLARTCCALFYPLICFALVLFSDGQTSGEYTYYIMLLLSVIFFRARWRQLLMLAYLLGFFVVGELINARAFAGAVSYQVILNDSIIFLVTTYVLVVITDLFIKEIIATRKKNTELLADLSASNQELKKLNYMVSHDLRTPLRQIVSFSDLAILTNNSGDTTASNEFMQEVGASARRLYNLTDELLSLANLDHEQLVRKTISLKELFARTTQQFISAESPVIFETDHQNLKIRGNAELLTMVLQNLVENGIKYNKSAHKHIRLSAAHQDGRLEITVQDNGIGIDPAYREKIFEAFLRLHGIDTYPGSGLGLAIVRKIVNLHGGTIELVSSDQGAKFLLRFPGKNQVDEDHADKPLGEAALKVLHKVKQRRAVF